MKKYLGIIGLLVVAMIWGGGFVASDLALESFTPFQIMVMRFFMATILMLILSFKYIRTITKSELKAGFFLGVFLFLGFAFQTIGLSFSTPSKNAFLTATNVVFVPFIALVIYKKKVSYQSIIGAVMAIIGAGVLALQKNFSIGLGDSLTLLCAVSFAFQIFLTGEYVGKNRVTILNLIQMLTAFVFSAIGMFISGDVIPVTYSNESLYSVLYLGLASTALAFFLQTVSQKHVDETKSAIIMSMEAVFGTLFSIIILKEMLSIKMVIGCILILSAVLVSEIRFKNKENTQK
jgi:drug/metabolite transporter (DMT)-like permease